MGLELSLYSKNKIYLLQAQNSLEFFLKDDGFQFWVSSDAHYSLQHILIFYHSVWRTADRIHRLGCKLVIHSRTFKNFYL